MFSLRTAAHSEIGLVRSNNQDSAYTSPSLIVVADGMGGAAAGDLASSVAIRELQAADAQNKPERLTGEHMLEVLGGALTRANDSLADLVAWDHTLEGMGTTVCGAMFSGTQLGVAHIGDSRGYVLREGKLIQITHDHSWVQSLVDEGKLAPEEMATHPHRSLLMKVLNGQPTHSPDFLLHDVQRGDRLLFCSDGLSGMVTDQQLSQILGSSSDLKTVVRNLTKAAHAGGGADNITLIVSDVVDYDPALEAVEPKVWGAATTMSIPSVDAPVVDLGDSDPSPRSMRAKVPPAPAPIVHGPTPPEGLIDPDRFETIRYAPHIPSRRRRWIPTALVLLTVFAVVFGAIVGTRTYIDSRWFISADTSTTPNLASVNQGLPDEVLGQRLYTPVETSQVVIDDLPPYYAAKVRNAEMTYTSIDEARSAMENLAAMAERCRAERAAATGQPTPSATPGEEESPAPDNPTASESATMNPSPSSPTRPDLEACA